MDWNKYKRYSNQNWTINNCCYVENTTSSNFWDIVEEYIDEELQDNVVADVTDSYKELSSERIND